jgi:phosphoribosylaminoimidazolecarboxamide formyltransferase/IMP cyclohydrolase
VGGRIVVLVSGAGSNMEALVRACARGEVPGDVVAVLADRECAALDKARRAGVAAAVVSPRAHDDRTAWSRALLERVLAHAPDLVVSAGFMRILAPNFVAPLWGRLINLHPSLLPAFPGAHAVRDALAASVSATGSTVHFVDDEVDHGPVIVQQAVPVRHGDTEDELHERIKEVEHRLLPRGCRLVLEGAARPPDRMRAVEVRRALISVSDKKGVVDLARALAGLSVGIVSSGGTATALEEGGVPVTRVSDVTGAPEILDGRVKTLHPRIHGAILADRRRRSHRDDLAAHDIDPIDLVVCNLYPFESTLAAGASDDELVERIDVGGPAMVRAAAKNFASVVVVTSPARYGVVLGEIERSGSVSETTRRMLALEAFAHTAAYDAAIARWLAGEELPRSLLLHAPKERGLRYGENPHQSAALYRDGEGVATAEQLAGKELSYNNLLDADAAWRLVGDLEKASVVIVKHCNPCGVASAPSLEAAYERALECDRTSAFGGIVALNGPCDRATAARIAGIFTEVVIAPGYDAGALEILRAKKDLRVLRAAPSRKEGLDVRSITGGLLVQTRDALDGAEDAEVVTHVQPTGEQWDDLRFAWSVAKHTRSNAIVLASEQTAVGIGAGQMSRVEATELAARRAGDRAKGAVCASDAFFPFRDGLDAAVAAGATAVIQPGGSVRDREVIAAADEHGIPMVLTGRRHFRH